jgi:hypothetical protein
LLDQCLLVGKFTRRVFGVFQRAVNQHVEHSASTWNQISLDSKGILQLGGQTDRRGSVVSTGAVGDRNFHSMAPREMDGWIEWMITARW